MNKLIFQHAREQQLIGKSRVRLVNLYIIWSHHVHNQLEKSVMSYQGLLFYTIIHWSIQELNSHAVGLKLNQWLDFPLHEECITWILF